jgi:hypothetical protein
MSNPTTGYNVGSTDLSNIFLPLIPGNNNTTKTGFTSKNGSDLINIFSKYTNGAYAITTNYISNNYNKDLNKIFQNINVPPSYPISMSNQSYTGLGGSYSYQMQKYGSQYYVVLIVNGGYWNGYNNNDGYYYCKIQNVSSSVQAINYILVGGGAGGGSSGGQGGAGGGGAAGFATGVINLAASGDTQSANIYAGSSGLGGASWGNNRGIQGQNGRGSSISVGGYYVNCYPGTNLDNYSGGAQLNYGGQETSYYCQGAIGGGVAGNLPCFSGAGGNGGSGCNYGYSPWQGNFAGDGHGFDAQRVNLSYLGNSVSAGGGGGGSYNSQNSVSRGNPTLGGINSNGTSRGGGAGGDANSSRNGGNASSWGGGGGGGASNSTATGGNGGNGLAVLWWLLY